MKKYILIAFVAFTATLLANTEIAVYKLSAGTPPNYNTDEARALQAATLAKTSPLTPIEFRFVLDVQKATENIPQDNALSLAFYQANATHFAAKLAFLGSDPAAWTPEVVATAPLDCAGWLCRANQFNRDIATQVVGLMKNRGNSIGTWRKLFKLYRGVLTSPEKIALTQGEVSFLTQLPGRNADQNNWLSELTLDLVSLQLLQ